MKHGIICPISHLSEFAIQSKFHLILPHLFKDHPEYRTFYRDRITDKDFVMMDNSFFELHETAETLSMEYIIDQASELCCNEMVAPEESKDSSGSIILLEEFLHIKDRLKSKVNVVAALQGKDIAEMTEYFVHLNDRFAADISCIGVPFVLDFDNFWTCNIKSKTLRRVLNRWALIDSLLKAVETNEIKCVLDVHLFGLSDPIELQRYKGIPWIRSNDSSSAYVHGSNGIKITDRGLPGEKISKKLDFSEKLNNSSRIQLIHENIQKILSFCE